MPGVYGNVYALAAGEGWTLGAVAGSLAGKEGTPMGGFEHIVYFIVAVALIAVIVLLFLQAADRLSHMLGSVWQDVLGVLAVFVMIGALWMVAYLFWFSLFSGVLLLAIIGFFYSLIKNTIRDLRAGA